MNGAPPPGELQWDYFVVPNKAGAAAGRAIGLNYFTEPSKDKILDPAGPLFFEPPVFGSKEWARLEVLKDRPPSHPNWVRTPAPIHWIRKIYGSFDAYWDFQEEMKHKVYPPQKETIAELKRKYGDWEK